MQIGTHLAPHEILSPLGAGGMGELMEERRSTLIFLNRLWFWDPLRGDPRFKALTKRIGLPSVSIP